MSAKQRILQTVGFLINCGLFLLCSCTLAVMAATWTDVSGKKAGFTAPFNDYVDGFPDWRSCQQACVDAPNCSMFVLHESKGCKLGPDGALGIVLGVLKQRNGYIVGQIDANGTLIWLGASNEAISGQLIDTSEEQSIAMCRQKCESPVWFPPCLAVEWPTSHICVLKTGYFHESQMGPISGDSATKQPDVPDPTGYGTRIAASKLPPPPAPLNGAIPPYVVMPKGLPSTATLQADVVVENVTECATLCHTTDNCYSFLFKPGNPDNKCDLLDYAAKGVMNAADMYQYGIIDRDGPSGNIESIIPMASSIKPTAFAEVYDGSLTMDECATLCYEHHEPFYCTVFKLVDNSTCYVYTIDYFHHLNSTAFAEPPAGTAYGRIDDGRRAFHHPTDNGEPIRQMDDVRPLPRAKKSVVFYHFNGGIGRNGTAPREVATLKGSGSDKVKRLLCAAECFTRRQWCRGVSVDTVANVCRMYETPVGGSDQLVDKTDSSYGDEQ